MNNAQILHTINTKMRTGIMNNIYNNRSRKFKCRENKCLINDNFDYVFEVYSICANPYNGSNSE